MSEQCCIGISLNENICDVNTNGDMTKKFGDLTDLEKSELTLRVPGVNVNNDNFICLKHYNSYVKFYSSRQTSCCNPFLKHEKSIKSNLRLVELDFSINAAKACKINIAPGKKLCVGCFKTISSNITDYNDKCLRCADPLKRHRNNKVTIDLVVLEEFIIEYISSSCKNELLSGQKVCRSCYSLITAEYFKFSNEINAASGSSQPHSNVHSSPEEILHDSERLEFESMSQKRRKLDMILDVFEIPPFKKKKMNDDRVIREGLNIIQTVTDKVSTFFEDAVDVTLPKLKNVNDLQNQSHWFEVILKNIQSKYNAVNGTQEKISLLTLLPDDWDFQTMSKYFECSRYMFNEARKTKEQLGVMGIRKRKVYSKYSDDIRNEIKAFYLDESNSRTCSGMKEVIMQKVKGQKSVPIPKRLLLYSLSELYTKWITETHHEKIPCLAFFAQLKPNECVFPGDPGTHSICACPEHQNIKLKIAAIHSTQNYRDLMEKGVCSMDDKNCMLHNCQNCPKESGIEKALKEDLNPNIKKVHYNNWVIEKVTSTKSEASTSSKTYLRTYEEEIDPFLEDLKHEIFNLTRHHFISEKQKEEFKLCKKNVDHTTGMMVSDFAENHPFIVQDSTQGFYFNNTHASLYTAVFHFKNENELKSMNFCIISDCTKHSASSIHIYNELILNTIKQQIPSIESIQYYSDGTSSQFKNKNHFINLCHHEEDYGLKVKSHSFFATAHGRTAGDGIGAVAKSAARRASLLGVKITNAKEMFDYLNENILGIRFLWVDESHVLAREKKLKKRFDSAKTLNGTRQYHCFEPIDKNLIRVRLFSSDSESEIKDITK